MLLWMFFCTTGYICWSNLVCAKIDNHVLEYWEKHIWGIVSSVMLYGTFSDCTILYGIPVDVCESVFIQFLKLCLTVRFVDCREPIWCLLCICTSGGNCSATFVSVNESTCSHVDAALWKDWDVWKKNIKPGGLYVFVHCFLHVPNCAIHSQLSLSNALE